MARPSQRVARLPAETVTKPTAEQPVLRKQPKQKRKSSQGIGRNREVGVLSQELVSLGSGPWESYVDHESGHTYYHNPDTGQTSWDAPMGKEVSKELKGDAVRMAELVMSIADQHCHNELLNVNQLRTFLSQVSDPFCRWLTTDMKQFAQYDVDGDGAINKQELERACTDFLVVQGEGGDDGMTM
eukprot:TRINITY_DN3434_c0_g1_i2.p1 TRINITY_DN3434_c0_g1~~TRINITY_DN3434_c0_g1_i2.p1  ORF type:complete len:185 (-),score=50.66 TRINITY_DN3434_c0_g1_i2:224-778(-)